MSNWQKEAKAKVKEIMGRFEKAGLPNNWNIQLDGYAKLLLDKSFPSESDKNVVMREIDDLQRRVDRNITTRLK